MCRWSAWIGDPIFLKTLIYDPEHSLVDQSQAAEECKAAINADGFGVAWYDALPEPGLYRDVFPAWSDPNLRSITEQISARIFLAHVRASTGTATSRNNCHPFRAGKWAFMHNGQVGGFEGFRREADMAIPAKLYPHRLGATDSEVLFLLALAENLAADPNRAVARATERLEENSRRQGCGPHMRMRAAFSDGTSLYAVRYASDNKAPSLYYRQSEAGFAVVSEPYDAESGWTKVAQGQFCRFTKTSVTLEPFELPSLVCAP
ncbi:MAG: class II glutamine amidotransferase [Paracoccaceae bacterium]